MDSKTALLGRLVKIMERLRGPDGCPWDKAQTLEGMSRCLVGEVAELLDAIEDAEGQPSAAVCEELGDVLMNIVACAQIAADEGAFTIAEVADGICSKLVRRHPHVFGDTPADNVEQVLSRWNAIKAEEKKAEGLQDRRASRLDTVPRNLPALQRAYELGRAAAKAGFDWPDATGAMDKLREEVQEVQASLNDESGQGEPSRLEEELGDLLFSVVNVCRKLDVRPERALGLTMKKFLARFRHIEENVPAMEEAPLEELELHWQEAKQAPPAAKEGK